MKGLPWISNRSFGLKLNHGSRSSDGPPTLPDTDSNT
jgi:hypothetical protein